MSSVIVARNTPCSGHLNVINNLGQEPATFWPRHLSYFVKSTVVLNRELVFHLTISDNFVMFLTRSGWIKHPNKYHGLKGGYPPPVNKKIIQEPACNATRASPLSLIYEFEDESDYHVTPYKKFKQKTVSLNLCKSLVLELIDTSVSLSIQSKMQLKKIFDSILTRYGDPESEIVMEERVKRVAGCNAEEDNESGDCIPYKKAKKDISDSLCRSLLLELSDTAVSLSIQSEIQLMNILNFGDEAFIVARSEGEAEYNEDETGMSLAEFIGGGMVKSGGVSETRSADAALHDPGEVSDEVILENIFKGVIKTINGCISNEVQNEPTFEVEIKLFQCLICNLSAISAETIFDSKIHNCLTTGSQLICDLCKKIIARHEDLSNHREQFHPSEPVLFLRCNSKNLDTRPVIQLKQNLCSKSCPNGSCFQISNVLVEEERNKLIKLRVSDLHSFLLERLNIQKDLGIESAHSLRLGIHSYCKAALIELFGISKYLVQKVFSEHLSGYVRHIHGNFGNLYSTKNKNTAIAFILHFAKCHSENLPDKSCLRLPSYLNIKTIFANYKENTKTVNQVSEREFYLIFQKVFGQPKRLYDWLPRITFMPDSSHPVCNECALISDLRKLAKTESERHYAEGRKRNHLLYIRRKYLLYCYRRELALRYPSDYLHLSLDDMDQKKLHSPFTKVNTKETSNMLRLNNHLTGCILTNGNFENDRIYKFYVNNDQFCQGSNKTISIIVDLLIYCQSKLGSLPKKFMFQSDNCHKDLKNQYLLSFFYLLVELNVFDEIEMNQMPVGHTHNDVDFLFSLVAAHLKKMEIPTFEILKTELSKVKIDKTFPEVIEMLSTTDFSGFIKEYLLPISGHTSFFQFKIRKENDLTKLYLKEDELDDSWKFPRSIQLLSRRPENFSFSVSPFRTETDYSEIFDSIWKKYIPTLNYRYSAEDVLKIRFDWEKRINFLISLQESEYRAFDILSLKTQTVSHRNQELDIIQSQTKRKQTAVTATFYPQEISSFTFEDLQKDTTIVFYCETKRFRPWIGLFLESVVDDGTKKVKVEWLKKSKKHYVIDSKPDGSCYTSEIDVECVMFADILVNTSPSGDRSGPFFMEADVRKQILDAYDERDNSFNCD